MEVNLYHILFIVLVCLGLVLALYPKKAIIQVTKTIASTKKDQVINLMEISVVFSSVMILSKLTELSILVIALAFIIYLELRLRRWMNLLYWL